MKSQFVSQWFKGSPLGVIAMMLFVVAFAGLMVWVFGRRGSKAEYQKHAQLPLEE